MRNDSVNFTSLLDYSCDNVAKFYNFIQKTNFGHPHERGKNGVYGLSTTHEKKERSYLYLNSQSTKTTLRSIMYKVPCDCANKFFCLRGNCKECKIVILIILVKRNSKFTEKYLTPFSPTPD